MNDATHGISHALKIKRPIGYQTHGPCAGCLVAVLGSLGSLGSLGVIGQHQVRAFFRGASPRTAQFCTRRMTRRQLAGAGTATLRAGERVNGVAACFTDDERVGAVRLYTFADEAATAEAGDCVTEYRTVWCQRGWTVQGVQLYFDRAAVGPGQASLVGLRPLCVNSA